MGKITRRVLLGTGAVVGGGLALGIALTPNRLRYTAPGVAVKDERLLNTWVKITPDNIITVINPHSEMGQGSHTGIPMMLAEELEADMSLVRMEEAPAHPHYANNGLVRGFATELGAPAALTSDVSDIMLKYVDFAFYKLAQSQGIQVTGGSSAIRFTGELEMRRAGAAAKEMLLKAAAKEWGVDVSELVAVKSVVRHDASGKSATFGELATAAAEFKPSMTPTLKDPKDFTIIGTNVGRFDVPSKVDGTARFGIDAEVPGLLYAAIRQAPVFGGKLESCDEGAIAGRRGIKQVVKLDDAVVVVADNYWRAEQALAALPVTFSDADNGTVSSESIFSKFSDVLSQEAEVKADFEDGDPQGEISAASNVIEAEYKVPYLAHAPMEPLNCTASVNGKTCEVWVGHQNPLGARVAVAAALETDLENVTINNAVMGGGFGRRFQVDNVIQAVKVSQQVGAPVKLIWSREEDLRHDFYRPAVSNAFKAVLDDNGMPKAWVNKYTNIGSNEPADSPLIPYNIPHQDIHGVITTTHVPNGAWRSVGHTQHSFFNESFIDELAHVAGRDPFEYRRDLLAHLPRYQKVLVTAADAAQWATPLAAGRARGIALEHSFGSIVAQVVEISLGDFGQVKVEKVTCAVDCGRAVNPRLVESQMQSGIIYGLTAALYGNIEIVDGAVAQGNFPDYEMVRLEQAPIMDVHIIDSGEDWGGVGEPGTPPITPAVANAIFALTGERVRELPLNKYEFKLKDAEQKVSMRM